MRQRDTKQKEGGWYYRLELSKKRSLWGIIFLTPWLLGFLLFFLKPLVESIFYSFNTVKIVEGGVSSQFVGLSNYVYAFKVDTSFNRLILTMVTGTLPNVLVVIIFSLLAAILINGKYPGRGIARTIFFIPIIMGSSIASAQLAGQDIISQEVAGTSGMAAFGSKLILDVLSYTGLPQQITGLVSGAVGGIFQVLAISGVPILIFLAGLQSISPALYEVAQIEGASAYETFWKVTLPMVSPMVLVCTVYSMIDAYARHSALMSDGSVVGIVSYMLDNVGSTRIGAAAAMTVIFMLACIAVISIVSFLISRVVFYYD